MHALMILIMNGADGGAPLAMPVGEKIEKEIKNVKLFERSCNSQHVNCDLIRKLNRLLNCIDC